MQARGQVTAGSRCIEVAGMCAGWGWGGGGTFLDELAPALGPVRELLRIRLLDLGALLHAVHQVVAQAVPVIDALHRPLVVPHLAAEHRARLPRAPRPPARPPAQTAASRRERPPPPPPPARGNTRGAPDPFLTPHCLHTPSSHFKHNFLAATKCKIWGFVGFFATR